ncbi:hypothetical protein OK074_4891 [Actinobacteria bacterium OK074]|nr:hypothetical protein OK074_4891 [Actinobacteria bacterium OK074]
MTPTTARRPVKVEAAPAAAAAIGYSKSRQDR